MVGIRAMGVVEVYTTGKTAGTRTRPNSTVHPHVGGIIINPQTHRDMAPQTQVQAEGVTPPLAGAGLTRSSQGMGTKSFEELGLVLSGFSFIGELGIWVASTT